MKNILPILVLGLATMIYACKTGPEVITTESGLKVEITEKGEGAEIVQGSTVTVHYKGMLEDGTVFDESYKKNRPFTFRTQPGGGAIKGWIEGLPYFNQGGKGILTVPSSLGYGKRGFGNAIPPDATLTFEIEVVDVK